MVKKLELTHISAFLLIFDFLALIFLGKTYTKFLVLDFGLYAHDFLLIIITALCLFEFDWKKNRLYSIESLIIIALLYLVFSFIKNDFDFVNKGYFVLRQYAIFGYLTFFYIITKKFIELPKTKTYVIKLLYVFGIACVVLQLGHIINLYINTNLLQITERNVYSPMVVMGFFVFASLVLTRDNLNNLTKFLISAFVFVLSISIGHDSVYLGLLGITVGYIFLKSNNKTRVTICFAGALMVILILFYAPSFSDVNAQWRIIFWKDLIKNSLNNYVFFGNGFGVPYASVETVEALNNLMISEWHDAIQIVGAGKYETAPHNSYLSMILHLGVTSILLLIIPLRHMFRQKAVKKNNNLLFLTLSFIGMSIWCFFNVILELPHSSSIYWIVYFILAFSIPKITF